jgi:hypothetical protein
MTTLAEWSNEWRNLDRARISWRASQLVAAEAALQAATADATRQAEQSELESARIVASYAANGGSVKDQEMALEACRSTHYGHRTRLARILRTMLPDQPSGR